MGRQFVHCSECGERFTIANIGYQARWYGERRFTTGKIVSLCRQCNRDLVELVDENKQMAFDFAQVNGFVGRR